MVAATAIKGREEVVVVVSRTWSWSRERAQLNISQGYDAGGASA